MNSTKVKCKTDTIKNSKNRKTSDPCRLLLNLSDTINLKKSENILLYQVLVYAIQAKI